MAKPPKADPPPSRVGSAIARWFGRIGASEIGPGPLADLQPNLPTGGDSWDGWLADPMSQAVLAGTVNRPARSRQQIYEVYQDMVADPVVASALRLHVTAALGGHETKGSMVFVEPTVNAKKDTKKAALVAEVAADLGPLFDRLAPTISFGAILFGDAYGRIYAEQGVGIRDVYVDELVYPPLVQPYERANITVGYEVSTGSRYSEKLTVLQIARMKMPRLMYLPQSRVIEKALRISLKEDRLEALPATPALAGGSFLDGSELAYQRFSAAWVGLVGQRVQDSINESLISVQQAGMTKDQRKVFKASLAAMFERSNAYIEQTVAKGKAVFGRIFHFIPTSSDKQLTEIRGTNSSGRPSSLTIDDVMMHARFLAGSLGMDLSMIGFADQLGGGLGEGGFFRVSAQAAERSRAIRAALTEFYDHLISVHLLMKHGLDLHGQDKPWQVSYYSGISALESERAKTKADAAGAGAMLVQTMAQLKELGLSAEAMAHLLEQEMGMDSVDAKMYADALEAAKPEPAAEGEGGGGFGGPPGSMG